MKLKSVTGVIAILILAITFTACSKKDKVDPPFVMEGLWIGKLGDGTQTPGSPLIWNLKAGGIIERVSSNGNVSATGTWTLQGNAFTATYTFQGNGGTASFLGTIDKASYKIDGTWSNTGSETGIYYVTKDVN